MKRIAYAFYNPKGYLHTFWDDTGRLGIYASKRAIEDVVQKRPEMERYEIVEVEISLKRTNK